MARATDERQVRLTHLHEDVHRRITTNSSLGALAIFAGTYASHGNDLRKRASSSTYVDDFCERSLWAQEGCSTVSDWIYTTTPFTGNPYPTWTSIAASRPRTYLLAFDDYQAIIPELTPTLPILFPTAKHPHILVPLLAECVAITAMSPAVPEPLVPAVLSGEPSRWRLCLAEIWQRFRQLRTIRSAEVLAAISRHQPVSDSASPESTGRATLVRCLSEVCKLSLWHEPEPAFTIRTWCQQLAPELIDVLRFSSDKTLRRVLLDSDVAPETGSQHKARMTISEVLSGRREAFNFVELLPLGGEIIVVVHQFDKNGSHVNSALDRFVNVTAERLSGFLRYLNIPPGATPGQVVEAIGENIQSPELRSLIDHVGHESISLGDPDPDTIQAVESLGAADGVALLRVRLRDGRDYCQVVANEFWNEPALSPALRALSWVIRNGELAGLSWSLRHKRSED